MYEVNKSVPNELLEVFLRSDRFQQSKMNYPDVVPCLLFWDKKQD
jgi:hypothetical protein